MGRTQLRKAFTWNCVFLVSCSKKAKSHNVIIRNCSQSILTDIGLVYFAFSAMVGSNFKKMVAGC